MNITQQIKLMRRIKADLQKELAREPAYTVVKADLEEQVNGCDSVIATLTKANELLNALDILREFKG